MSQEGFQRPVADGALSRRSRRVAQDRMGIFTAHEKAPARSSCGVISIESTGTLDSGGRLRLSRLDGCGAAPRPGRPRCGWPDSDGLFFASAQQPYDAGSYMTAAATTPKENNAGGPSRAQPCPSLSTLLSVTSRLRSFARACPKPQR